MELETGIDFGGEEISKYDILSDDLICKIKNLNPILGTPEDPMYDRYQQYRNEFANAELIIIDANALNRSSISSLDLSGCSSDSVDELPDGFFQTVLNGIDIAFGSESHSNLDETHNMYPGFEDYEAFGDEEYSSLNFG